MRNKIAARFIYNLILKKYKKKKKTSKNFYL